MPTTSATFADIASRAAKFIGNLAAGEVLPAEEAADILDIGNGMLDAWSMDRLYIYGMVFGVYALTANQQDYPIGPTATAPFNLSQVPVKIEGHNANIVITSQSPNIRRPLYVMDDEDWLSIRLRTPSIATIPTEVYLQRMNEATYPNATLHFWPPPQSGLSVELETWTTISQFAALTDPFHFPPGYYEAVYQNIGLRMCTPENGFTEVPPSIAALAQQSRERIEALNMDPPPQLRTDAGLQGVRQNEPRQSLFNIRNPSPQWYR